MEKKRCKVIMLPTAEKSRLFKGGGSLHYLPHSVDNGDGWRSPQHLYITSDDKIEVGDWCINGNGTGLLVQCDQHRSDDEKLTFKKIIATTDLLKLYPEIGEYGASQNEDYVPQIPQSFIEEYCRKGGIDEVDVEYGRTMDGTPTYNRLIVNSDNTINIYPIKDSWTRDEVIQKLHDIVNDSHCKPERIVQPNSNKCAEFVLNWIKEKL